MNPVDMGRNLAALRKKAGYTQASLSEMLGITDKAVSKWERGLASPDISLLPKLSVLFDSDIDSLLYGIPSSKSQHFCGILVVDEFSGTAVYGKPLVYFLLSNFMLLGIRNILIVGPSYKNLLQDGSQWGITLSYAEENLNSALHSTFVKEGVMLVYGNYLIYGAGLTRRYQALMNNENGAVNIITHQNEYVPISFCSKDGWDKARELSLSWKTGEDIRRTFHKLFHCERKLDRGTVCLPMNTVDEQLDAAKYIQFIEHSQNEKVSDLREIALSRGLIK